MQLALIMERSAYVHHVREEDDTMHNLSGIYRLKTRPYEIFGFMASFARSPHP